MIYIFSTKKNNYYARKIKRDIMLYLFERKILNLATYLTRGRGRERREMKEERSSSAQSKRRRELDCLLNRNIHTKYILLTILLIKNPTRIASQDIFSFTPFSFFVTFVKMTHQISERNENRARMTRRDGELLV